jgi:hypothetical protein
VGRFDRLLRREPYDLEATRACLEERGYETFEFVDASPPGLKVADPAGHVTFVVFHDDAKSATADRAPPPFGPEVHRNVVVSNLGTDKNAVADCLRTRSPSDG